MSSYPFKVSPLCQDFASHLPLTFFALLGLADAEGVSFPTFPVLILVDAILILLWWWFWGGLSHLLYENSTFLKGDVLLHLNLAP